MQPQGSAIFNKQYVKALTQRINNATDCHELQEVTNDAIASIQAQSDAITAQLAALQPMLALLKPPTSLNAIISWLSNFITSFLTPYMKPYVTYAAQAAEMVAAMAELTAAIQEAAGKIKTCTIEIPAVSLPDVSTVEPAP
ncbi:hypothetical protein GJV26_00120 [Massilia dura]|uniref:Uncharacterized protein n=1 Tax=Pseudoduganella dura TaxID=321982 RepID=A0A6I3XCK4_9BURK|nr:hypothetical protein [Pseudoduganella dura]MUI10902.1 hypothetical protein [Pseudoduganella dura]GGY12613.1 hypothetical protein GCM10007386_48580 [Pseudoduganella dura]